jgi:50S ribosomal protein L16 3-hydroxylase
MSYSIGFRSPKEQELLSNFADYVLANDIGDVHLHNPELSTQTNHGEIQASDEKLLTEMLKSALNSPQTIKQFLGEMLSQSRHQLDVIEPEQPLSELELRFHFESHGTLCKVSGLRALYHQDSNEQVFINGEAFNVEDPKLIHILCNSDHIDSDNLPEPLTAASVTLLTELVNKGYWYLD